MGRQEHDQSRKQILEAAAADSEQQQRACLHVSGMQQMSFGKR